MVRGDRVVVLPPFGDGTTELEITAVGYCHADGTAADAPDPEGWAQYEVGGAFYVARWLEVRP
jgi:hypothetical protein